MTPIRQAVRSLLTVSALVRIAITAAAVIAVVVALSAWIGDQTAVHVDWLPTRPGDLLRPSALYLVAIVQMF